MFAFWNASGIILNFIMKKSYRNLSCNFKWAQVFCTHFLSNIFYICVFMFSINDLPFCFKALTRKMSSINHLFGNIPLILQEGSLMIFSCYWSMPTGTFDLWCFIKTLLVPPPRDRSGCQCIDLRQGFAPKPHPSHIAPSHIYKFSSVKELLNYHTWSRAVEVVTIPPLLQQ